MVSNMKPHERLIVRLAKRVESHEPRGLTNACGEVTDSLEQGRQTAKNLCKLLTQLFALGLKPIIVQVGQQVILIQPCRLLERSTGGSEVVFLRGFRCSNRRLEFSYIN